MDILELINNDTKEVINPNYNSKSKKNIEPKTISIPNMFPKESIGTKMAIYDFNNQYSINSDEAQKYKDAGLNWNPYHNFDKDLADSQSNWSKAFNSLGQTIVSEIGLGTARGFSDLFDFVGSNILHITEDDYQNPVSEKIQEWQDAFNNNVAPIYTDPELNIQNGGMKDFGWWAKNIPNIASTLTLLIPGEGATMALSKAGKAARIGKGVSKARRWLSGVDKIEDANRLSKLQLFINNPKTIAKANEAVRMTTEAMLMRTMENYQEARDVNVQTYQDALNKFSNMSDSEYNRWIQQNGNMFDDDIDKSDRDTVAKAIAKKAADRTFTMDFSNAIFDVIQLHGLKNVGKGIKKASGRLVDEAQKASLNAAEEFATGVTKEVVTKPLYKKVGQGILDFAKYNAKTALEESTEGIEEAVNYIAQQEGLTYGKAILEGNAKDYRATTGIGSYLTLGIPNVISTYSNMQGELSDYMKTPELQESAFWGLLGGWVFAAGGNVMNRTKLAFERKAAQEKRKENPITGEKIEDEQGWFDLFMMPEDKAAKEAINRRQTRLNQLSEDLKLIENGIDIFGKADETGKKPEFTGDIELKKALARQQVENQYKADLVLDAMNSGTFDLMLNYFKSDEVKKAMVKAGLSSQEEIDAYTTATVKQLEDIRDNYARQSTHVLNQIAALNAAKDYNQTIPLEYAQIIATENTKGLLQIDALDKQIANAEAIAAEDEANTNRLNPGSVTPEDKETVRLGSLIDMYGRLTAESKELQKQKEKSKHVDWRLETAIKNNKRQRDNILNEIKNSTVAGNEAGMSAVFNAVKYGHSYVKGEDGKYSIDNAQFERTDEEILKEAKDIFGTYSIPSNEVVIQTAKAIQSNIDRVTGKNGLANFNSNLLEEYVTLGQLNMQRNLWQSQINSTKEQIKDRIDFLHNNMNEARVNLINKAQDIILNAIEQYDDIESDNGDNIVDAITKMYHNDKQGARALAESFMSDSNTNGKVTAAEFMDALDIFNFTNATNEGLYQVINETVEIARAKKAQERAKDNGDDSQNSTTNNQSNSSTENQSVDNSSSSTSTSNTKQVNGQNGNVSLNQDQQQNENQQNDDRPTHNVKCIINTRGSVISMKNTTSSKASNITARENEDGTFELDISGRSKNEQVKYIVGGLFDGDVDLLDTGSEWKISKNPIVKRKGNGYVIVEKGQVVPTKFNDKIEGDYNALVELAEEDENLKDILTNNPNAAVEQVKDLLNIKEEYAKQLVERYNSESSTPVEGTSTSSPFDTLGNTSETNTTTETEENNAETQTTTTISTQPVQTSTVSSTGEQAGSTNTTTSTNTVRLAAPKTEADIDATKRGIAQTFGKYIPNMQEKDINFDEVASKVEEELVANADKVGLTPEQIKEEVAKQKETLINAHNQLMTLQNKLSQSGATLAFAAKYEEPDTTEFSLLFVNAVEAFMEQYKKIMVVPEVDGKQVVKLEDILRICNNVYATSDNSVAKSMYNVVYNYLNSPIGKAKYIVTDLVKHERVLDNINRTSEEIQDAEDKTLASFRVNIAGFIEAANANDESIRDNYFKVLDSINRGDKLQMMVSDKSIAFLKDGVVIGNMPIPYIHDDSYAYVNDGWVTYIKLDGSGNPISRTKDVIEDIFVGESKEHTSLRKLILKASLLNKNDKDYKDNLNKLAELFSKNPIIEDIVKQSKLDRPKGNNLVYVDDKTGEVDYDRLLRHLGDLWGYSTLSANASDKNSNIRIIKRNLNRWFRNLYDTYDAITNIDDNGEVTVTDITEGQVIRATDDTVGEYDSMPLVSDALAASTDARIAIVDSMDSSSMNISGRNTETVNRFNSNSTFIAVFSRNQQPDYVKAWGIKLSDVDGLSKSSELKAIGSAATATIEKAFKNFVSAKGLSNLNEIENIIRNIVRVKGDTNRISLFSPVNGNITIEDINIPGNNAKGITVHWTNGTLHKRFRIYSNTAHNGVFGYRYDSSNIQEYISSKNQTTIATNAANAFMRFIIDTCNVNISSIGVKSDNVVNNSITGFIKYKNGKLVVDIPGNESKSYHKEFDSYNDYLIKNNLLRVNTKKGENGTNFERRGKNQVGNQNLYVSLPKGKTSVQSGNIATDNIKKTSDADTFNAVKDIIANDKTNVGLSIFEKILGEDTLNKFKEEANNFGILNDILPTRIIYDQLMNGLKGEESTGVIAYSDGDGTHRLYDRMGTPTRTKARMPVGENVVVGSKFVNMASSKSIAKRKEAIRKLIHEQLHIKLQSDSNNRFNTLISVNSIYEEFNKHLKDDLAKVDKSSPVYAGLKYINSLFAHYTGDRLIEEFMVESLTNKTLFDYLNSIKVENAKDNEKADTLFTKIAKFIAKFFGWNINDESLYMKELNALRDITSSNINDKLENEPTNTEENSEEETKPLEENSEEETEEPTNEDEEEGFDAEEYDEDEDDEDATAVTLEEPTEDIKFDTSDKDGFTKVFNIDSFKTKLPLELQNKFDKLKDTGWIEVKCS